MADYQTAFPSKYLKAADLGSTRPIGTIESVDMQEVGSGAQQERKLVVQFIERALKGLVLNKVNCETIAEVAQTNDYERWAGTQVQLFASKTEFQGKRVPCIRICAPPAPSAPPVPTTPAAPLVPRRPAAAKATPVTVSAPEKPMQASDDLAVESDSDDVF